MSIFYYATFEFEIKITDQENFNDDASRNNGAVSRQNVRPTSIATQKDSWVDEEAFDRFATKSRKLKRLPCLIKTPMSFSYFSLSPKEMDCAFKRVRVTQAR